MSGYVNRSNFVPSQGEVNNKPSLTVPNQSISLREMLNRHLNGGAVKQYEGAYLQPDNPIPVGFESLSKIDNAQMLIDVSYVVTTTRGRIMTRRDLAEAARKRQEAADYQAFLDQRAQTKQGEQAPSHS